MQGCLIPTCACVSGCPPTPNAQHQEVKMRVKMKRRYLCHLHLARNLPCPLLLRRMPRLPSPPSPTTLPFPCNPPCPLPHRYMPRFHFPHSLTAFPSPLLPCHLHLDLGSHSANRLARLPLTPCPTSLPISLRPPATQSKQQQQQHQSQVLCPLNPPHPPCISLCPHLHCPLYPFPLCRHCQICSLGIQQQWGAAAACGTAPRLNPACLP